MQKLYRAGMYAGKFMPYHHGHVFCLETASHMCEVVYQILMIGGVDEERILAGATSIDKRLLAPEFRLRAMKAAGDRLGNVQTILMDISGCRTPAGEEDWDAETPLVLSACRRFDAVFSSEVSYGPYFSRAYPWARHVLVDPPRAAVPISGTEIRAMEREMARKWMP